MDRDRYILKPLPDPDGKRGFRLDIDEFIADNKMTNLFILGLADMQKDNMKEVDMKNRESTEITSEPDWLNYYSLGSIHWLPREDWDGVPNDDPDPANGYCHHGLTTFSTWHRPYLALYEQAIHQRMVKIAKQFKNPVQRDAYLDAAARWRLPYWDPIMPRNERKPDDLPNTIWGIPLLLKAHDVYVKTPEKPDDFTKIENPLYSYKFPTEEEREEAETPRKPLPMPGYNTKKTTRRPRFTMNRESDDQLVDLTIQRQASDLATMIFQMLHPDATYEGEGGEKKKINSTRGWDTFSNHSVHEFQDPDSAQTFKTTSLEEFHDMVHDFVGQGENAPGSRDAGPDAPFDPDKASLGQMGDPAYAGFEPIFWMHHNNVDRLLSIWQALNTEQYEACCREKPEFKRDLKPFRKSADSFYNSTDPLVKNYWSSGFAVPGNKQGDPAVVREQVQAYLVRSLWWAANNQGEMEGWPKHANVNASEALWGKNAEPQDSEFAQISCLTTVNGVTKLVQRSIFAGAVEAVQDRVVKSTNIFKKIANINKLLPGNALAKPDLMQTWNANVRVKKFGLDGSFSVHLFIGKVDTEYPHLFMTKKNEVGFVNIFAAPKSNLAQCANCAQQDEDSFMVEGVVPMTTKLHEYLDSNPLSKKLIKEGEHKTLADLTPASVVPFLKEHLTWKVIMLSGRPMDHKLTDIALEVTVTRREFEPPSPAKIMGAYGPIIPYPEVTQDKEGGAGYSG